MTPEQIDNKIDEWHTTGNYLPLHQFLNMSLAQYRKFVEKGEIPPHLANDTSCDLFIQMDFPVNDPENYTLHSNIKQEHIAEVLATWIQAQGGQEPDESEPEERELYRVVIYLDTTDDTFSVEHNCGNMGLVTGIVMEICNKLNPSEEEQCQSKPDHSTTSSEG